MTQEQAGELLLEFPKRWEGLRTMRERRQAILDEYRSAAAYDGSRVGQGGYSDTTGKKAGRLAEMDGHDAVLLEAVRSWLTVGLTETKDRAILTDLWQGMSVQAIVKRRNAWDIGIRWQQMTQRLIRFVGDACGGYGPACVNTRQSSPRG